MKIVFLTHSDATFATEAFRARASGYVVKSSSSAESVAAIQEALGGRRIFLRPLPGLSCVA